MSPSNTENTNQSHSAIKKSMVMSGLVGTVGFFIAKAIGLIYSIPFSSILGSDAYMSYYGSAYRIYSYILNIFTAGFPFAIATLVSKYDTLKNYKTVLQIKKVSIAFMAGIGLLGMAVMMALSSLIAPVMAEGADGAHVMTVVLCLLAIAIFFVPILSAYRGFIQGCREMEEYAFSQAFEQIFRVGFLLSVACLMVYGLGMARVWALYAAVLSTSVAAIAGLIQIIRFSKKPEGTITALAHEQTIRSVPVKPLFKEFVMLAVPYMISAILGYSDDIFNTLLLPVGLRNSAYNGAQIDTVMSAVNYAGTKLTAIPMILAPGFTAAIIPHISAALVEKDYRTIRKNVRDCLNIVVFIGLLLSFCIALYSTPLFYTLFYTSDLALSSNVTRWCAVEGFLSTVTPVISSMMMALRLQRSLIKRLSIATLIKGLLIVPFTSWWGFGGTVIATTCAYGYLILMNCTEISIRYHVRFKSTLQVLARTLIGLGVMCLVAWGLDKAGLGSVGQSKLICFAGMMANGLLSVCVFAIVELILQVPQSLFHFRFSLADLFCKKSQPAAEAPQPEPEEPVRRFLK